MFDAAVNSLLPAFKALHTLFFVIAGIAIVMKMYGILTATSRWKDMFPLLMAIFIAGQLKNVISFLGGAVDVLNRN